MLTLLQRFCPLCFKGNRGSCGIRVSPDDPRVCPVQVQCAKTSATLRCLDFTTPGEPCRTMVCQITCLVCGKAIANADEPDFQKLSELDPVVLRRNNAVVTALWPRNPVHKSCCRVNAAKTNSRAGKRESKKSFYSMQGESEKTGEYSRPESKQPKMQVQQATTTQNPKPSDWTELMGKMLPAAPKKPKAEPKKRTGTPAAPPPKRYKLNPPPSSAAPRIPEFDINQHGYVRKGGTVYYKTPDGVLHECCGVDSFGPHKLASEKPRFH